MESPPLHTSPEWFQTTLASIGDAVIATDRQGRVVFLNPVAAVLTGWPEAEALGQDITVVFRIVNEVTRQGVENPVTRVLREGTVVGLANQTLLLGRDGVERPIDDSGAPIYDAQGQLLGVVLVFRDITERRRAEAARTHLAAIVESSDDAIIGKTLEGIITSWNRAAERLYGYTAAEMIGQPIARLIPPDLADDFPMIMARLRRGERIEHYETQRLAKDGTRIDVALTISPLRDQHRPDHRRLQDRSRYYRAAAGRGGPHAPRRHCRIRGRRHHQQNAGGHHHELEPGGRAALRLHRGRDDRAADCAADSPRPGRRSPDDHGAAAAGRTHRALRDAAPGQGRHPHRRGADHLPAAGSHRPDHRRLQDRARYHGAEAGRGGAGAPPPGNGAAGGLAQGLSASLELETVLQRMVTGAQALCGSERVLLALREPGTDTLVGRYEVGTPPMAYTGLRIAPGQGLGGQVLRTGRPWRTADYATDPRFSKDYLAGARAEGHLAVLAVPIRMAARVEGLLYASNPASQPFTDRDEAILVRLAAHAAVALQNAHLYQQAQAELAARRTAEAALAQAAAELEQRVAERTAALQQEMAERQRLAQEAQRLQHFALLGRLAAGVSHEIRNPLGAIFLHVDLLEEELREPSPESAAQMAEALAEIKQQLARLDDLVQDYLSLVRAAQIERTPQDLGAAVRAWATEWQALATAHGSTVQLEGLDAPGRGGRARQYPAPRAAQPRAECPGGHAPGGHADAPGAPEAHDGRARRGRYRRRHPPGPASPHL